MKIPVGASLLALAAGCGSSGTPGAGAFGTAGLAGMGVGGSARSGGGTTGGGNGGATNVGGTRSSGDGGVPGTGGTGTAGTGGGAGTGGVTADGSAGTRRSTSCASISPKASFVSDWTADPTMGKWRAVQVVNSNRMKADGTLTWHGAAAARVEVDPGDDPLMLGENTERTEALIMQDTSGHPLNENPTTGTQYIATSYLFPTGWDGTELRGDSNSWSIVLQLHGPDNDGVPGPDFSLSAARRTMGGPQVFGVDLIAGDQSSCCGTSYSFSDGGGLPLGKWVDLEFMFTFASDATGRMTIWRRDQGQTQFTKVVDAPNIATLQYNSQVQATVGDHYWKQGLYRGGDVNGRVDVLWVGPAARGTTFEAAECAAFGTSNGSP